MKTIQKVHEMLETMLEEADACGNDEECEHIYCLFNDLEDWAAEYENSEFK